MKQCVPFCDRRQSPVVRVPLSSACLAAHVIPQRSSDVCITRQDHTLVHLGVMASFAAARPVNLNVQRSLLRTEAEVQRQIILTATACACFDLTGEGLVPSLDDDS